MKKLGFIFFLLFTFSFFLNPLLVKADESKTTISGGVLGNIEVTQNPNLANPDNGPIQLTFRLLQPGQTFPGGNQKYYISAQKDGGPIFAGITPDNPSQCNNNGGLSLCVDPNDPNQTTLKATWSFTNLTTSSDSLPGNWKIRVGLGGDPGNGDSNVLIVPNYPLTIQQLGGGTPILHALNDGQVRPGDPVQLELVNANTTNRYGFWWSGEHGFVSPVSGSFPPSNPFNVSQDGSYILSFPQPQSFKIGDTITLCMDLVGPATPFPTDCSKYQTKFTITTQVTTTQCSIGPSQNPSTDDNVTIATTGVTKSSPGFRADRISATNGRENIDGTASSNAGGGVSVSLGGKLAEGDYIGVLLQDTGGSTNEICRKDFHVGPTGPGGTGTGGRGSIGVGQSCKDANCSKSYGQACDVASNRPDPNGHGIYTAIGCIDPSPTALIKSVITLALGASGGVALLLMVWGAFQMITAAGNPESVKKGQETFSSAIIGLLFIIFAILLLRIIGVDILQIPGLSQPTTPPSAATTATSP